MRVPFMFFAVSLKRDVATRDHTQSETFFLTRSERAR